MDLEVRITEDLISKISSSLEKDLIKSTKLPGFFKFNCHMIIKKYLKYMNEIILPIYTREFHGPKITKFVHHRVPEGFGTVIGDFCSEITTLDHITKFSQLVESNDTSSPKWKRVVIYDGDEILMEDCFKIIMESWLKTFLQKIDDLMVEKVIEAINKSSENRCKLTSTVYDFTTKVFDKSVIEILNFGRNFVIQEDFNIHEAKSKFEMELFRYLRNYRKYIQKENSIEAIEISKWLIQATLNKEDVCPHVEFYKIVQSMYNKVSIFKKKPASCLNYDFKALDKIGVVVMDCDKNSGICLLNIEDAVSADEKMIGELGGEKCITQDEESIKNKISSEILKFEFRLCIFSKKYLDSFYPSRISFIKESALPYMKLTCKIHKLSTVEIKNKNTSKLKFRPVIDSSRTPLHYFSKALMEYVKGLTRKLIIKYFPGKSPLVKNGHEVSNFLKTQNMLENSRTVLAIADLSSAYSYVYLDNLVYAMKFAARELEISAWKTEMFEEMARLVLNNSYVTSSCGIYKLASCLPMGLGCSGECLDLVCLVCEISFLGKQVFPEFSPCSELDPFWNIKNEARMANSIYKYWRYRDDTFSYIRTELEDKPIDTIHALGSIFLTTLDVNVNLSHYVGSFLDCFFFKKITGFGFHTLVRRKGQYPVSFQHAKSNIGKSIVNSIISGETLRHRRLCSSEKFIIVNDDCLQRELISRGHKKMFIKRNITKRINDIKENYDQNYDRKDLVSIPKNIVFGSITVQDNLWNTHTILKTFLKKMLTVDARLPMIIPGPNLRTKYYAKRRYLKMSGKYLKNKV